MNDDPLGAKATRTAQCACGQLVVTCKGDPEKVSACHCLECQRRTGSVFGIAAFYRIENTSPAGASSIYERIGDSGFAVTHHFCPHCGSTVYWYPARKAGFVAVAVGSFADPSFPAPEQMVYEHHRHHWLAE